jgi:excisionase family DNA binding protein
MNQEYQFDDPILTVKDVSAYLKISKPKIYRLIQQNQIPHIRINRNVRIRYSDLLEWLDSLAFKAVRKL